MTKLSKRLLPRFILSVGLPIISVALCAWDDASDRVEFVTRGVGDAVEVNKVTQTIDPWPPYVKNRRLNLNGRRAGIAMQRYQNNQVLRPHPLSPVKAPEIPIADQNGASLPPQPQQ